MKHPPHLASLYDCVGELQLAVCSVQDDLLHSVTADQTYHLDRSGRDKPGQGHMIREWKYKKEWGKKEKNEESIRKGKTII